MFSLALLSDSVRIHPKNSHSSLLTAVTEVLNTRYCNKILAGVGLVVKLFDVTEMEDPLVHPGESHSTVKVKFRLVVFKPFVGEVLVGRIRSCTEEGLSVSLTFFDDIFIPAHCLQPGTTFNAQERLWVWNYDGNELFMDLDEVVRFRCLAEAFTETAPVQKEALMAAVANKMSGMGIVGAAVGGGEEDSSATSANSVAPYRIIATMAEDGLGLISWWS